MAKGLIQRASGRLIVLLLMEMVLIVGAITLAAYLRVGSNVGSLIRADNALFKALLITYVCQMCLYYADLYDEMRMTPDRRELLVRIFQSLGATSIILALLYYVFPSLVLGRGIVMIAAMLITVVVISWRIAFSWFSRQV